MVHRDAPLVRRARTRSGPSAGATTCAQRLPRFAYFPFGGGPRLCIGNTFALMEAALLLATIAQRFRFRPAPGATVTPMLSVTLRPAEGLPMILAAR